MAYNEYYGEHDQISACPFCGEEADVGKTMYGGGIVMCENEQCRAEVPGQNPQEAITKWNTRGGVVLANPPLIKRKTR